MRRPTTSPWVKVTSTLNRRPTSQVKLSVRRATAPLRSAVSSKKSVPPEASVVEVVAVLEVVVVVGRAAASRRRGGG